MKSYKIALFIVSIIAVLILLSLVYPKDGITIGDMTIKFVYAKEFLADEEEERPEYNALEDAEKIRQFIYSQKLNEDNKRRSQILRHKYAIAFPNDSIEWFDDVFIALSNAKDKPVRIMHYGDSQIEEDRISGRLRTYFQDSFGGHGVGIVPASQTVPTSAIGQRASVKPPRYLVFGKPDQKRKNNRYGPMGQMATLNEEITTTFFSVNLKTTGENTKQFSRLTAMIGHDCKNVEIKVKAGAHTESRDISEVDGITFVEFELPDSAVRASITIKGATELYGFLLDDKKGGVSIDNIPMRGCSGTIFTSMDSKTLSPFFAKYDVPLIILQYGGNTVPYLKNDKSIEKYCDNITRQIKYINKIAPESKILFIGPSDMTTRINGKVQTYPILSDLIAALKNTCTKNNAAYWDMSAAMGGNGAMIKWVQAEPALAASDYVHLTSLGTQRIADMLHEIIMATYDYYLYRNEEN